MLSDGPAPSQLPDIQKTIDPRGVRIDQVGVCGIVLPIRLARRDPILEVPSMDTVATFSLSCSLDATVKGTHMSRFTEVLQQHLDGGGVFSHENLQKVALELAARLGSNKVTISMACDYFVFQNSPATDKRGVAPLRAMLDVTAIRMNDPSIGYVFRNRTGISIDGKTCCPCSREISDFNPETGTGKGAHAQRGRATIYINHGASDQIWFEDLVDVAWAAFSAPVYPVLKRPDERAVTMAAYGNPKFVEDVSRDLVLGIRRLGKGAAFNLRVENSESIHYHNAFAEIYGRVNVESEAAE